MNRPDTGEELGPLRFDPHFDVAGRMRGARVSLATPARDRRRDTSARSSSGREASDWQSLRCIISQVSEWRKQGLAVPALSMAVGPQTLSGAGFAQRLGALMAETETPRCSIELLLTEDTISTALLAARGSVNSLMAAGLRFGLCDFSLGGIARLNLRSLPFHSLRLSCSAMFRSTSPQEALWLTRSAISAAHRCGLIVVGEDIATRGQQRIMVQSGCDLFQGSLLLSAAGTGEMAALVREAMPLPRSSPRVAVL